MGKRTKTYRTIAIGCLLCAGAMTLFLWPNKVRTGQAQAVPADAIVLTGTLRDFRQAHPDFNVTPPEGAGHYAGTVAVDLAGQVPAFTGPGYKVSSQWRDAMTRPIAPHLYRPSAAGGSAVIPVTMTSAGPEFGIFDSWDSRLGPYGGENVGPTPTFEVGGPMPAVSAPTGLYQLPNVGDAVYNGGVISGNIHCNRMSLDQTVQISGHVTVLCETMFSVEEACVIELLPDARLTVYLKGASDIHNWSGVNANTLDPNKFVIYNVGTSNVVVRNHAMVYARVVSPHAGLDIDNHAEFFGSFIGNRVNFKNHGSFHLDIAPQPDLCGNVPNDVAGVAGVAGTGGITSAATFNQWFRDVLGTNISKHHEITLTRDVAGVYSYLTDAFHPIDERLYGNEGAPHNHGLTYTIVGSFVYDACAGQYFEFEGGDGAWLFVNGQLVMDLGGAGTDQLQHVDLDRLGLADGVAHGVRLFYAQRNPSSSTFRLRTNVAVTTDGFVPTATNAYD